jgi:hypothetical protein
MSKGRIGYSLLVFSFFFCNYVLGATSATLVPAPASGAGALEPLKAYTQAPNFPEDVQTFIANRLNACQKDETRDVCFVRYTVHNVSTGKIPIYAFLNSKLECPQGYYVVSAFDNKIINNDTGEIVYYYESATFDPVSEAQYNTLGGTADGVSIGGAVSCSRSGNNVTIGTFSKCIEPTCGGEAPLYKAFNGIMGIISYRSKSLRDTYNQNILGNKKCDHYSLAGCPFDCSQWMWGDYVYDSVQCTRKAGFYPNNSNLTVGQVGSISPMYTPSVVICSKPNIVWH